MPKANARVSVSMDLPSTFLDGGFDSNNSCSSSLGSDDPLNRDWLSESLDRLATARTKRNPTRQGEAHSSQCYNDNVVPFTIVSWNIWFSRHEWQARLEQAIWQTLQHQPDVFCFQEVTTEVHGCMLNCVYLRERYEPTEQRLPHGYDVAVWVRKDYEAGCRSLRWNCMTIPLESIYLYGRSGLCIDLEILDQPNNSTGAERLSRVRVVTTHLESGRENGAMRKRQMDKIFSFIRNTPWNNVSKNLKESQRDNPNGNSIDVSILAGDFNLDPTYPENELVESNGIDVWSFLRPNDDGFTEDTYKNEMRYLAHGKHKQVRFDRILLVPQCATQTTSTKARPMSIYCLGVDPFDQVGELWVSDHFGLVARLELSDEAVDVESYHIKREQTEVNETNNDGYTTP